MFFYQLKKISKSTPIFHIYLIPTFFMYKKTKKKLKNIVQRIPTNSSRPMKAPMQETSQRNKCSLLKLYLEK